MDPIQEGIIVKLASWGIDAKYAPAIEKIVLQKNANLAAVREKISKGEINV